MNDLVNPALLVVRKNLLWTIHDVYRMTEPSILNNCHNNFFLHISVLKIIVQLN